MKGLADFTGIVGLQGESDELSIGTADIYFGTCMVILHEGRHNLKVIAYPRPVHI